MNIDDTARREIWRAAVPDLTDGELAACDQLLRAEPHNLRRIAAAYRAGRTAAAAPTAAVVRDATEADPDAVRIGVEALTECGWAAHTEEGDGADNVSAAVCLALTRAGKLHPGPVSAAVTRVVQEWRSGDGLNPETDADHRLWSALDALGHAVDPDSAPAPRGG